MLCDAGVSNLSLTKTFFSRVLVGSIFLFSASLAAQTIRQDVDLVSAPSGTGLVQRLKAGTPFKLLKRDGYWVQIEVTGKTGWVKVSALSFSSNSGIPTAIDTGRLGTGNIVSASAVRGLSAKDLIGGSPRFDELKKLDLFRTNLGSVQAFMNDGQLTPAASKVSLRVPIPENQPKSTEASQSAPAAVVKKTEQKKAGDDW